MHRPLPDRPSLEYLKKEAKAQVRALRRQRPAAKLADAQHALAREYGFTSWIRLTRHVNGPVCAGSPFAGTWKASVAKSTGDAANQFRGATLQLSVRGKVLTIAQSLVTESGEATHDRSALHVDGREHVSDDRPGLNVVATWRGLNVLRVIARKGDEVVNEGTYRVSADGRELSIMDTVADLRLVFERER